MSESVSDCERGEERRKEERRELLFYLVFACFVAGLDRHEQLNFFLVKFQSLSAAIDEANGAQQQQQQTDVVIPEDIGGEEEGTWLLVVTIMLF